jgi:hypothetical protein
VSRHKYFKEHSEINKYFKEHSTTKKYLFVIPQKHALVVLIRMAYKFFLKEKFAYFLKTTIINHKHETKRFFIFITQKQK